MSRPEHWAAGREARRLAPGMARGSIAEQRADLLVKYLRASGDVEHRHASAAPVPTAAPTPWRAPDRKAVLRVRDIMLRPPAAFPSDAAFLDMARAFTREPLSAVPVVTPDGQVVGVVSETDLLASAAGARRRARGGHRLRRGRQAGQTARDLMTAPAVCVHPDTTVAEAALRAARGRLKRMPVTDHRGRLVGVVRRTDLLHALVRDDAAIREEIERRILVGRYGLDPQQVCVHVANGRVTLTGRLDPGRVSGLMAAIREIDDVVDVTDHLSSVP